MRDLIAKLEAATGPSRALDYQIYLALRPTDDLEEYRKLYETDPPAYWFWMSHQEYTASIDAAVALTERVLPDVGWSVATNRIDRRRVARLWTGEIDDGKAHAGASPAIALCLAILRAKEDSA